MEVTFDLKLIGWIYVPRFVEENIQSCAGLMAMLPGQTKKNKF